MLLACTAVQAGYKKAELLQEFVFETPDALKGWKDASPRHFAQGQGVDGGNALYFKCNSFRGADMIYKSLDKKVLDAELIWLEATVRCKDVQPAKQPYLGTKVMLTIKRGTAERHPEPRHLTGTLDWTTLFTIQKLDKSVTDITLTLGIQCAPGEFWVDSVRIYRVVETDEPMVQPPPPKDNPEARAIRKGANRGAKYRGVMSGTDMGEEAFKTLAAWNVNLIRYQMRSLKRDVSTPEKYLAWIRDEIKIMDDILTRCKKYNIKMCIDIHTGPSMRQNDLMNNVLMDGETNLNTLDEAWRILANHYKGNPLIYGYDLLNEPKTSHFMKDVENPWLLITERLIKVIRPIDPDTPIITEPNFRNFQRVSDPNVIYSPHFYSPHSYTHIGVGGRSIKWSYPGYIDGEWWDKEALRVALKPDIEFQRKYKVPMFVGEFSAAIWADGADQYIRDCIELFEEYGWDWTYHAFREASIWDVEKEVKNGRVVASKGNPRQDELRKGLARNNTLRVMILGNSITRHGPNAKIGWHDDWGMAASAKEKDFVHLLKRYFTEANNGKEPNLFFENIATFERQYKQMNIPDFAFKYVDFRPDILIMAIGENTPVPATPEEQELYFKGLNEFLTQMKKYGGNPKLYVRSCFWPSPQKDAVLKRACEAYGGTFIDIGDLGRDKSNRADAERKFDHPGVAGHPGDKGMKAIADAIWSAINK